MLHDLGIPPCFLPSHHAGAGRLRRLMRGGTQSMRFAAPPEVAAKIRLASRVLDGEPLRPPHVLRWVMANTVEANQAGVVEFCEQVRGEGMAAVCCSAAKRHLPRDGK